MPLVGGLRAFTPQGLAAVTGFHIDTRVRRAKGRPPSRLQERRIAAVSPPLTCA